MNSAPSNGFLYIVATPIGNLEDMTFRAVKTLKEVDYIAAEDTRHSMKLLTHYGITNKLLSCHEHNEKKRAPQLIEYLKKGLSVALISDAGTPSISDPGYNLVSMALTNDIQVIPIPGCSAAITGLCVSGLPTDNFYFQGFLPKKTNKQNHALEELKHIPSTLIFYESPKRIKKVIERIIAVFGDREAFLAREITKRHEEFLRGSLSMILELLNQKDVIKGEISLFVQGCRQSKIVDTEQLKTIVEKQFSTSDAGTSSLARQISEQYHVPRNTVYDIILGLKKKRKHGVKKK